MNEFDVYSKDKIGATFQCLLISNLKILRVYITGLHNEEKLM